MSIYNLKANIQSLLHQAQVETPTYLDYTISLFKSEIEARKSKERERRVKRARLPRNCDLDKFDFAHGAGMTPFKLKQLRELLWVDSAFNIILMGPAGTGKTYIAAGLLNDAISHRMEVVFGTMEEYVYTLRTKDSLSKSMLRYKQYLKCKIICIDEVTLMPLSKEEAVAFFNFINALHERISVIFTTNKAPTEWVEIFAGDKEITTAILDRVLYKCDIIRLDGSSYRMDNRTGFLKEE